MKKIAFVVLSAIAGDAFAQNNEEVLKYSLTQTQGSIRSLGAAGAWGAVGADLGAAAINPAGLGFYKRNEMMTSFAITSTNNTAKYNGNETSDARTNFNIPNLGAVFFVDLGYTGSPVNSLTFAFGMNRLANFQNNMQFNGRANNTSIGDYLATLANGIDSNAFLSAEWDNDPVAQAWRLSMIYNDNGPKSYGSWQSISGDSNYTMRQNGQYTSRGRINEWYASAGINIGSTLYLGASLIAQGLRHTQDDIYREFLVSSSIPNNAYESASINQYSETRGSGIGGKFGAILRPIDALRIGISYHTPVRLNLTKEYQIITTATYDGFTYTQNANRLDQYNYQVITPSRLTGSAAIIIGKFLILSGDVEQVDYSAGKLNDTEGLADFSGFNDNMKALYTKATNIRTGLEIASGFSRWRLGYANLGSPFNTAIISKEDGQRHMFTGGFGWVLDDTYFFDLAVQGITGKNLITPYGGIPSSATNQSLVLNFMFGTGVRF